MVEKGDSFSLVQIQDQNQHWIQYRFLLYRRQNLCDRVKELAKSESRSPLNWGS